MPVVVHILLTLAYAGIAAGIAALMVQRWPSIDTPTAILVAGVIFALALLLHEIFVRVRRQADIVAHIHALRTGYDGVMGELVEARGETRGIHEALVEGRQRARDAERKEIEKVASEVRILQSIVEQLCDRVENPGPNRGRVAVSLRSAKDLDDDAVLAILREGLRSEKVDLYVQPIVSLPQRKRRFYECFSRIHDAAGLQVVPEQYLAIAAEEGLIVTLDNLFLFRCVQLIRRARQHNKDVGFFCNISRHTVSDHQFFKDFVEFIADNAELAPNLVFELSQADLETADSELRAGLERLSNLGFRFSMDRVTNLDFDIPVLAARNVRFVKIEAGLFLSEKARTESPLEIRDLKKALDRRGIDLIVEKIETEQQLREILDYNIDFGQGYLFGEPRASREAA